MQTFKDWWTKQEHMPGISKILKLSLKKGMGFFKCVSCTYDNNALTLCKKTCKKHKDVQTIM